ncbi:MAG: cytochrome c3 family protein [Gammaproteobacteria bacterium]|nr:cytochrome c3 family protein [Gammaproteobacteria bacterium]
MNRFYRLIAVASLVIAAGMSLAAEQLEPVLKERGRHFQTEGEVVPVGKDGIHDPENPAVTVFQPPSEALTDFPRDSAGIVDWVQAVKQGYIEPRADIDGVSEKQTLDLDIIFTDTGAMPNVRFPHLSHTLWLDCSNCHPAIFVQQKGASKIAMNDIFQGKYCGVCHGKVAFPPTLNCARCHSVPKTAGQK